MSGTNILLGIGLDIALYVSPIPVAIQRYMNTVGYTGEIADINRAWDADTQKLVDAINEQSNSYDDATWDAETQKHLDRINTEYKSRLAIPTDEAWDAETQAMIDNIYASQKSVWDRQDAAMQALYDRMMPNLHYVVAP